MNGHQFKGLKNGDEIIFDVPFQPFTSGKAYKVYGIDDPFPGHAWVRNDKGMGLMLNAEGRLFERFKVASQAQD